MKIWKNCILFYLGGMGYMLLEFAFRGWSHGSMFLAGGICFVLIGHMDGLVLPLRIIFGSLIITAVELGIGMIVNQQYQVWDYRAVPFNFQGQICLPFTLLWIPVSFLATILYDFFQKNIDF